MKLKIGNNGSIDCGRKGDLIAYMYEESEPAERASFELHLRDCESCRRDVKVFERVRDDLSTWQVSIDPRTEIALPKPRFNLLRELVIFFPAWARGTALAAAGLSLLLFALSFASSRFAIVNTRQPRSEMDSAQIESLIKEAVAKERASLQEDLEAKYRAQISDLKTQIDTEHEAKLHVIKTNLKAEIKKSNSANASIRSFFAMDDYQDPWGDSK